MPNRNQEQHALEYLYQGGVAVTYIRNTRLQDKYTKEQVIILSVQILTDLREVYLVKFKSGQLKRFGLYSLERNFEQVEVK